VSTYIDVLREYVMATLDFHQRMDLFEFIETFPRFQLKSSAFLLVLKAVLKSFNNYLLSESTHIYQRNTVNIK
jgi:hypothetical protein